MDLKRTWRNGFLALAIIGAYACAVPAYANSVNLLVNGSFEDPVIPSGSTCGAFANCKGYYNGVPFNDNIGGWQLIGLDGLDSSLQPIPGASATIMLLGFNYSEHDDASGNTLFFHPEDGFQSIDLTGEGNQGTSHGIKQSVGTTIGSDYSLSFWLGHQYAFAPGYTAGPADISLFINGGIIGSFTNSGNTPEDVTWTPFSYQFAASDTLTTIAFLNNTPVSNNYAGLDNVSLTNLSEPPAVPETSSLVLLSIGLVLTGLLLHRRTSNQ